MTMLVMTIVMKIVNVTSHKRRWRRLRLWWRHIIYWRFQWIRVINGWVSHYSLHCDGDWFEISWITSSQHRHHRHYHHHHRRHHHHHHHHRPRVIITTTKHPPNAALKSDALSTDMSCTVCTCDEVTKLVIDKESCACLCLVCVRACVCVCVHACALCVFACVLMHVAIRTMFGSWRMHNNNDRGLGSYWGLLLLLFWRLFLKV